MMKPDKRCMLIILDGWGVRESRQGNAVAQAETELADSGRVVLRASGTEPVIRVMVEGENEHQVLELAKRLASVVAETSA